MRPINANYTETIFQQMTSAHQFVNISQNILNLLVRLTSQEIRHLGLQFEYKNEAISIRIEKYMIFRS